jgi:hypothetical protein
MTYNDRTNLSIVSEKSNPSVSARKGFIRGRKPFFSVFSGKSDAISPKILTFPKDLSTDRFRCGYEAVKSLGLLK